MKLKEIIIKSIPNLLTISRLIASVLGAGAFVMGNISWAIGLYTYGAVSDFFDGFAARKLNAHSEFGRKLDALSDKLYAGSLLIPSIWCGNWLMAMPLWLEWKISRINLKAEKMDFKPETQRIGKFKTATLFPTIIVGLLATLSPEFYLVLCPLLAMTTVLQEKTITVYENEFIINQQKNTSKDVTLGVDNTGDNEESLDNELDNTNDNEESLNNELDNTSDNEEGLNNELDNTSDNEESLNNELDKESIKQPINAYVNKAKDMAEELNFYLTSPYFPVSMVSRKKRVRRKF